jgi:methylated-DNA-[protein]-cysteine S-methyltransferase
MLGSTAAVIEERAPIFQAVIAAPFGNVGVRTENDQVKELSYLPDSVPIRAPGDALAKETARQIRAYLRDARFRFDLPLAAAGSEFQKRVWNAISEIPLGEVRSYGFVARQIKSAPCAVGQACGANWFPLVIPCHRVVGATGVGGFGGAAEGNSAFHGRIKRWLLAHEGASDERLRV